MSVIYTKDILIKDNYFIGDYSYGSPRVLDWSDGTELHIGKYCSIADNVTFILGGNHRYDWVSTYPFTEIDNFPEANGINGHPASSGNIIIGNDVWIGYGATILSGVTIADGSVIGADSVVSRNTEPYSINVGNPAKEVKKRFKNSQINNLLKIKWWNWSDYKVNSEVVNICSDNIDGFINSHLKKDN